MIHILVLELFPYRITIRNFTYRIYRIEDHDDARIAAFSDDVKILETFPTELEFPYKIENHDDDDVELQHSAMTRSLCVRYFAFIHISGD